MLSGSGAAATACGKGGGAAKNQCRRRFGSLRSHLISAESCVKMSAESAAGGAAQGGEEPAGWQAKPQQNNLSLEEDTVNIRVTQHPRQRLQASSQPAGCLHRLLLLCVRCHIQCMPASPPLGCRSMAQCCSLLQHLSHSG